MNIKHGRDIRQLINRYPINFNLGYGNSSPKFWSLATPLMWELRMNGRVLFGDPEVQTFPFNYREQSNSIMGGHSARGKSGL